MQSLGSACRAPSRTRNRHSVSERRSGVRSNRPRLRGRFFRAGQRSRRKQPVAHRVGIIGGDGIGPEVTAEALKVVRAAGVALDTDRLRPRRPSLPRDRRGAARRGARGAARLRRDPARRGRHARRAARRARARAAAEDALRARPLREPAAVQGRARTGTTTASTSSSSARTPKAPTRARAASCARARRTRSRRRAR